MLHRFPLSNFPVENEQSFAEGLKGVCLGRDLLATICLRTLKNEKYKSLCYPYEEEYFDFWVVLKQIVVMGLSPCPSILPP